MPTRGVEPGEATRLASELGPLILRYEIPAGRTYYRYRYPTFQGQPSFRSFHRATSGGFALYVNFGGGGCDCYSDSAPNAVRSIRQATFDTVILSGHEGLGGPVEVVSGETEISSEERLFNYHRSLPWLTTRLQAETLDNLQRSGEGPASQGDVYIGALRGSDKLCRGRILLELLPR